MRSPVAGFFVRHMYRSLRDNRVAGDVRLQPHATCGSTEDDMRRVSLLLLGFVLCGAASWSLAPGLAAQTKPAAKSATHEDHDMEKMLVAFADAWNRHDVDALMSFMTSDGVFESSGGNTVNGERYEGAQAVRAAYAAIFTTYPDARW